MSGLEGSAFPRPPPPAPQLQFTPSLTQILRPAKHLSPVPPLAAAPSSSKTSPFDHYRPQLYHFDRCFPTPGDAEKRTTPPVVVVVNDPTAAVAASTDVSLKQTNEKFNRDSGGGEGVIDQGPKEAVSTHITPLVPCAGGKRCRKPKASKNKRCQPETPDTNDGSPFNGLISASSCRYDSSLGLLTKKFISLLQRAEDGTLDLNRAADILQVQKRRIYDITNVLEGVGLIEKNLKNKIRLKGLDMSRPKELDDRIADLKAEIGTLYAEECRVDQMIRKTQEELNDLNGDINSQKWLYITKEDICSLPSLKNDTLIAIKAPHGTSVEVPDPDEGVDFSQRRYEIFIRSTLGPIDCYLISKHEEMSEPMVHAQQSAAMDLSTENCINSNHGTLSLPAGYDMEMTCGTEANLKISSDSMNSPASTGGIVKIAPSDFDIDADYWLLSDPGISMTDRWGTEFEKRMRDFTSSKVFYCLGTLSGVPRLQNQELPDGLFAITVSSKESPIWIVKRISS